MKLDELNIPNSETKVLKETFSANIDVRALSLPKAKAMLNKVKNVITESRKSPSYHKSHTNPAYLKMMMLEQALVKHIGNFKPSRIIVENEEVEKSQVILAAQDMVDSIQKMYEDVSDMLVKELPALSDSIQSEIGANESTQFNQAVSEALTALIASLQESKTTLQNSLNNITGEESLDTFSDEEGMEGEMDIGDMSDIDTDMDMDTEIDSELDLPEVPDMPEEPEDDISVTGRAKR